MTPSDLKKFVNTKNVCVSGAIGLAGVAIWNYYATSHNTYMMASGDVDINKMITDKIASYLPAVMAMILGFVSKFLGVSPEYVKAAQDFAKNPALEEIEQRFIASAIGKLTPLLGKYPEVLLSLLRGLAPAFADNPEIQKAVNALGQALVNHFFKLPEDITNDVVTPKSVK